VNEIDKLYAKTNPYIPYLLYFLPKYCNIYGRLKVSG